MSLTMGRKLIRLARQGLCLVLALTLALPAYVMAAAGPGSTEPAAPSVPKAAPSGPSGLSGPGAVPPGPSAPAGPRVGPGAPSVPAGPRVAPSGPGVTSGPRVAPSGPGVTAGPRVAPSGPAAYTGPVGRVTPRLSPGHHEVWVGKTRYYYDHGYFYRPHHRGWVVVGPPYGAVILALPIGFATLVLAGITYYTFAGIYYRQVADGYVVVEPPVQTVVEYQTPAPAPVVPAQGRVVVTAPKLNVRSGPSYNNPVIAILDRGVSVEIRATAGEWLNVLLPSGQLGWVMQQFTAPATPQPAG